MLGIKNDIREIYATSNTASRYVLINVAVFLLIQVAHFLTWSFQSNAFDIVEWLGLPANLNSLLSSPWAIFSYMFVHEGFMHLVVNMLWLFMAGRIFVELIGSKRFVKTYWLGGLMGGLLYLAAYNLMPSLQGTQSTLIGASGAVFAVFIALATYSPEYVIRLVFIGPVKLKWLAIVFVILMLPSNNGNLGGHIAHLGGALWGFFYARQLKSGRDIAKWFDNTADAISTSYSGRKKPKMKVYKGAGTSNYSRDNKEYNAQKKAEQEEIDKILDKISKSGYESLSASEKSTLFKASKKG